MDFKKTILWAVFSLSGLMLYNNWQVHEGKPSMFAGPQQNVTSVAADKSIAPKADTPIAISGATAPQAPTAKTAATENAQIFTLENDLLSLQISSAGANVVDAKLLKELTADEKPVEIFKHTATHTYVARSGLVAVGNIDLPNHNSVFTLDRSGKDGSGRPFLVLSSDRSGVKLEKTFTLNPGSYDIFVGHRITQLSANAVPLNLYTEIVRDGSEEAKIGPFDGAFSATTFTGPAIYTDGDKFKKIAFTDLEKNKFIPPAQIASGQPGWVAMVQHYFASAWIPDTKLVRDIYSGKLDNGLYRVGMQSQLGTIPTGSTVATNAQLFVGPQEERMLEKIAPGLELLKDYGYLTILAKPIFWLLEHIHNIAGNWGWSIILLTVLIKLVFFPLSAASYKSMARMKEVQPRLMAMKEQYKGEPQKLNQAMMEMYRKEKINPLGGCLPVLIQIPVFISLYWVLLSSVEMRGAPWVLWIHDLSVPDPYYILPVIMAVSMFVQTKLNPTPPDPVQAKVMLYMPIIFSIMFFFFPAGLVLYWVVNNLLSIAQQWQINKIFGQKTAK